MADLKEVFNDGTLKIDMQEDAKVLTLHLSGKSIIRDAMDTLLPIFMEQLGRAQEQEQKLVVDFRSVTYMNSSSFAPVIKVLEKARIGTTALLVRYNSREKWQETSFSALTIFQTPDGRIALNGDGDENGR